MESMRIRMTHIHKNIDRESLGTAGILQICNIARHSVVIIYVPIYHAFY